MRNIYLYIVLSLAACSSGDEEVRVNNQYAVSLPEGMVSVADLNERASLQRADTSKPLYVVVIDESKEEMKKHDLDYDLDLYFNNIFSRSVIESLSEVSISEPVKAQMGNGSALLADVTGKADTTRIYYKAAIIETPSAFYQVLVWTTAAQRGKLEEEMKKIAGSFKEL